MPSKCHFPNTMLFNRSYAALRYVERNPVRAGMVARAEDYPWSSARAHCGLHIDSLLRCDTRMESAVGNWSEWLAGPGDREDERRIHDRTYTGRPCGDEHFIRHVEAIVGSARSAETRA